MLLGEMPRNSKVTARTAHLFRLNIVETRRPVVTQSATPLTIRGSTTPEGGGAHAMGVGGAILVLFQRCCACIGCTA
eukprot:NODE_32479_length_362_cov_12.774468.p2 GENE.NODE_32479_length_362_cov_12.774468~~NODE_32479_length_362_cov_12.774468.p2  ORF type:complete len:77 (-),score=7.37 NODE_32479_length_362_cov_12.774468:44-274(-)